ncbi:hypothetical protein [Cognatiluteimonas sedimenti]
MMTDATDLHARRNRMRLLAIFALFLGTMLVAGALRFSGWRPAGMKNHGELLQPPVDLRARVPVLADGSGYRWNPAARTWRIVLAPPAACDEACTTLARDIDVVWKLMGRNADKVDVLWLCAEPGCSPPPPLRDDPALRLLQPDPALRAVLPRVDATSADGARGVPVYVVDPNGFLILRYPPGADPAGLRADLAKLLKLI